jgi:hypothetical protein
MTASTTVFVTPEAVKGVVVAVVVVVVPVAVDEGGLVEQAPSRLAISATAKSRCWRDGIIGCNQTG